MLTAHLDMICEREAIVADMDALAAIARAAEGSVRDSLSLLDQAAAMTADKLTNGLVADMLGQPGRSESHTILTAALAGDCATALAAFETAYNRGGEPEMLITNLLDFIHLASMQAAGGNDEALIESERALIMGLAEAGIARLGRAWQLLLKGHAELEKVVSTMGASDFRYRAAALRSALRFDWENLGFHLIQNLGRDESAHVRRVSLTHLRDFAYKRKKDVLLDLITAGSLEDRTYLESVGLAADG